METRKKKSFKRLFAFLMAFVMVTTLAVSAVFAAPTFKDVPEDHMFAKYIEDLAANGIISGYGGSRSGYFGPDDNLTRAQAAKIIALAEGYEVSPGFKSKLTDVSATTDMAEHIWALEEAGIVKGFGSSNEFRPDANITRGHVAKMVAMAFGVKQGNMTGSFSDLPTNDPEVKAAIEALASNGIVHGYGSTGKFRPDELVTRGQFSKMAWGAMNLELEIVDITTLTSKTLKVTFNREAKNLKASDFVIYLKPSDANQLMVHTVEEKDGVYTLRLLDGYVLQNGKTYTLTVKTAEGEFTYVAGTPTTLEFVKTTYKVGVDTKVKYRLLDQNGIDITEDYQGTEYDWEFASSKTDVVGTDGSIGDVEKEIGEVSICNMTLKKAGKVVATTGNVGILVLPEDKLPVKKFNSIGDFSLFGGLYYHPGSFFPVPPAPYIWWEQDPMLQKMFFSDKYYLRAELLDQFGDLLAHSKNPQITYRSDTPTIAVIEHDGYNRGFIKPVTTGFAKIVVTVTLDGKTVSKSFTVEIKEDPYADKVVVEKVYDTDLVTESNMGQQLRVTILDQYGNVFYGANGPAPVKYSNDLLTGPDSVGLFFGRGISTFIMPGAGAGDTTVTVTYGTGDAKIEGSIVLTTVEGAHLKEYIVIVETTLLDLYQGDDHSVGPDKVYPFVFAVDVNGNYLRWVPYGAENSVGNEYAWMTTTAPSTGAVVDAIPGGGPFIGTVAAKKVGKQAVTFKVKGDLVLYPVIIDEIEFEVVDSTPVWTYTHQTQNSVAQHNRQNRNDTLAELIAKLYSSKLPNGEYTDAAFLGYDQYGNRINMNAPASSRVLSTNDGVIMTNSTGWITLGGFEGTATVVLDFKGVIRVIDIEIIPRVRTATRQEILEGHEPGQPAFTLDSVQKVNFSNLTVTRNYRDVTISGSILKTVENGDVVPGFGTINTSGASHLHSKFALVAWMVEEEPHIWLIGDATERFSFVWDGETYNVDVTGLTWPTA